MRIGIVGPRVFGDSFAENVGSALSRLGHEVTQLGPARAESRWAPVGRVAKMAQQASPWFDERIQRRLVQSCLRAACEVVVNLDAYLAPGAVSEMRNAGIKVAFWFPDAVSNLGRQLMILAPYDAVFFKEPQLVQRLRAMIGSPVYHLPQACNPRWHRPIGPAGVDPHLLVAGNMYPSRVRLLERVAAKGIPLRLYGGGFPRWLGETPLRDLHAGRYITGEEKAKLFRAASGVLNTMHPAEIFGVNSRLFEAAGSGAAVLTEFRPVIPELFAVGEEVLTFDDFDQLIDQATRLLNEPGLTERLGDAATLRAHRDHTYELRVDKILKKLS